MRAFTSAMKLCLTTFYHPNNEMVGGAGRIASCLYGNTAKLQQSFSLFAQSRYPGSAPDLAILLDVALVGKDKRLENSKFSLRSSISCSHRVALGNPDLRPRRRRPLLDDARKETGARATCRIKARVRASVLSRSRCDWRVAIGRRRARRSFVRDLQCIIESLIGGLALGSRLAVDGTAQMAAQYHFIEEVTSSSGLAR